MNRRTLTMTALLALTGTAAAELSVSLDPLPFNTIQLAGNQYVVPHSSGVTIMIYSQTPLRVMTTEDLQKGVTSSKALTFDPLPHGSMRMNDNQYMIPGAVAGATVIVVSARTLAFSPAPAPVVAAVPGTGAAAQPPVQAVAPVAPAVQPTIPVPTPAPVQATPRPVTLAPVVPPQPMAPANAAQATPRPVAPDPVVPAPVVTAPAPAQVALPAGPAFGLGAARAPAATPSRSVGNLPEDLRGSVTSVRRGGQVVFTYTVTHVGPGTEVYDFDSRGLSITQNGAAMQAELARRSSSRTPGTVSRQTMELGSIYVTPTSSGPVTMTWLITDDQGRSHMLSHTHRD